MAGGGSSGASLEYTPTWALATVCFFFIFISIILEYIIHLLSHWLKRRRKTALNDALEKLKSELMLLGFMSLLLAVTQERISKICVPSGAGNIMLPCRKQTNSEPENLVAIKHFTKVMIWNLSSMNDLWGPYRRLEEEEEEDNDAPPSPPEAAATDSCPNGKVALMSQDGIHQLHIFIFVLAAMQIVYTILTLALGRAKMRRWEAWEKETQTTEYQVANDPNRFRFTRQTTFGRRHLTTCTETSFQLWIKCFFRQFIHSVAKVDYLTLRHGFISAHLSSRLDNFNFKNYIQRSLDEDFKVVVGISPLMWFLVVLLLLLDVYSWNVFLWVSYIPLLIVLILGTKLEVIVARMALQTKDQNNVIIGTPLVRPNDRHFWFGHPGFVLTLIHYTLFVNAFELAFFIWVTIQFGFNSCYHERTAFIITRIVLAVIVQVICSYITLPLYALVTQMGSNFKSKVLEEQMANIIRQWHADVRERRRKQQLFLQSPRTSLSAEWSPRRVSATEFSSFLRPTSVPSDSIRKREILEEEEIMREEAASSSTRPSRPVTLELSTVRRE
ncbi:MLO-like protein 3 isoform X1 [Quercus robur]|uniref:MLO-like protein 3 isoform X1 n=1 Tax=Quercus robur TaxID=38942 RepID=UPI002161E5FB|nr:MLO-like protein 3 isoform X1 [Quercus robur]